MYPAIQDPSLIQINPQNKKHISYSAVKQFYSCPFSYKLKYVDKIKEFHGNEYTSFGKAIHKSLEELLLERIKDQEDQVQEVFLDTFFGEIRKLPALLRSEIEMLINTDLGSLSEEHKDLEEKHKRIHSMFQRGTFLVLEGIKAIRKKFPEYSVVSVEEKEEIPIYNHDLKDTVWLQFKDLVIETPDGFQHIIDHKTTSWGWNSRKKNDKMICYQISFYKHFYSVARKVDPDKIKTYFMLLKRTAKKEFIEIFEVSSGKKRINNALTMLDEMIYNVQESNFPKNRTGCKFCDYCGTQHCPNSFGVVVGK